MNNLIHSVFEYLTDIPVNFWFFLLIVSAPIIVFSVKPSKAQWLRFLRLVFASILTYILIMTVMGAERSQSWKNYRECYASHTELRDMSPERNQACRHHLDRVPDSTGVFMLLFGWIPAIGYAGFWELVWRIWNRKKTKEMGKEYKGRWFSNAIILFFITIGAYSAHFIFRILYHIISKNW